MWALFDDERRSLRVVADTLGASRRSVSTWSKRYGWVRRVQRVAHLERCALVSYYAFIARRVEEELLAELEAPLASVRDEATPEVAVAWRWRRHPFGIDASVCQSAVSPSSQRSRSGPAPSAGRGGRSRPCGRGSRGLAGRCASTSWARREPDRQEAAG